MDDPCVVIFSSIVPLEGHINLEEVFTQVLSILSDKIHTVNRRLGGTVVVEEGSQIHSTVLLVAGKDYGKVRKLISKSDIFSQECYELCARNEDSLSAFIHSVCLDGKKNPHVQFPYSISLQLNENGCLVTLCVPSCVSDGESKWIREKLGPSIDKWTRNVVSSDGLIKSSISTHSLISVDQYAPLYRHAKEKWARDIAARWTDKTSPEKFVYEDCAIATYLCLLWKRLNLQPKKFVDVGCGNGLLVHLLNKFGFDGLGVDLRKRRIWETLFPNTSLIECTVNGSSSNDSLPHDIDYLIGNHSDELTPWIPLMAARRSIPFFLLPCCAFDFHGKLPRRDGISLYEDLIVYVSGVCTRLGYNVQVDRLAIPSTKRIALICTIPQGGLKDNLEEEISKMIAESSGGRQFIPRPKIEKVRNCSGIAKELRESLTLRVFKTLLEEGDHSDEKWASGGSMEVNQLVNLLTEEERKAMKEQCGGMQTFLKNQHQVFKIVRGMVKLKDWREEKKRQVPSGKEKTSPCWFHFNHPHGCPLNEVECSFRHN